MFDEEVREATGRHPNVRFSDVQDHVIHFGLVHDYIIQFGDKVVSSLSHEWSDVAELDAIVATDFTDGTKMLALRTSIPGINRTIAIMDENGKIQTGITGDYDFMAETLLDAAYKYEDQKESDQAFIAKLEI